MAMQNLAESFSRGPANPNGGVDFPDPWLDAASLYMPTNLRSVLYWAEFLFNANGSYRMAMERVLSYFLTPIEVLEASEDEKEKWEELAEGPLNLLTATQDLARDRCCYGNGFASVVVPFKRFLVCRRERCGARYLLKEVHDNEVFKFHFTIPEFHATCPVCGYSGPWKLKDEIDDEEKKIKLKRWNPHEIEILHDIYSHDTAYLWRIPEDYKQQIRKGHLFHLERVPPQVLDAIHKNWLYRFSDGAIFHMKEPCLGGVVNRGWGIPRSMVNFRQLYHVQVLRRCNEAIALDYVIPFRIITPEVRRGSTAGGGLTVDPLMMMDGNDFNRQVRAMINKRRRDPAGMNVLPFPVAFQMFGADAAKLAPAELMDQAQQTLLNDSGTPIELFNGSLQLQTAPVALRLFEATWHHLVHDNNSFLRWVIEQVSQILKWEPIQAIYKPVTIADDAEKLALAAQLAMSQQISGTSLLRDLGKDWKKEQKQIAEESRFLAETQARVQEEMQEAGFAQQIAKGQMPQQGGGQPAPGGDPSAGGQPPADGSAAGAMGTTMAGPVTSYLASSSENTPQTPQDMEATADSIAQGLIGQPDSIRDSELRKLKVSNSFMHKLVTERLDEIRAETRKRAGNQAVSQLQQPQPQAA